MENTILYTLYNRLKHVKGWTENEERAPGAWYAFFIMSGNAIVYDMCGPTKQDAKRFTVMKCLQKELGKEKHGQLMKALEEIAVLELMCEPLFK